ncbi:MAG: hypothetical protein KTV45_15890 [Acidimicrobiia bacterium]|nr:hypothetical protein [Acidimicrobiia bacterium]
MPQLIGWQFSKSVPKTTPSATSLRGVLLAQEITVVTETDPLTLWVSVVAVAIALGAAVLTYVQGRAIRQIESREHVWEAEARRSAAIRVLPQSEWYSEEFFGDNRSTRETWIRLENIGRAEARDVEWSISDNGPWFMTQRLSLEVIHPGEYYDIPYGTPIESEPESVFAVSWSDELGRHTTERILST